jgi:hypothetical protein
MGRTCSTHKEIVITYKSIVAKSEWKMAFEILGRKLEDNVKIAYRSMIHEGIKFNWLTRESSGGILLTGK